MYPSEAIGRSALTTLMKALLACTLLLLAVISAVKPTSPDHASPEILAHVASRAP
jgi:hypothetical protein